MIIELKKFGTTLISRQTGSEAFLAFQPALKDVKENEAIEIDFEGILTFSPSWGDEFLTPLLEKYGEKLVLRQSDNPSVKATLEMLEESLGKKFKMSGSDKDAEPARNALQNDAGGTEKPEDKK
ncbi:MAG: DUF4325 domain-containing protein [Candidatus Moranbacteria bacterium]|nr:DUF4325 domain-containing protein [Candidatus Moranbacteria bacterium]